MKKLLLLIVLAAVTGCSATIPLPPEPKGKMTSVNPDVVRLSDLEL